MNYQKALLSLLLVSSLIFTFFSNSYAMALIFVSSSGLFGFIEYADMAKEDELDELKKEMKNLSARVEKISLSRLGRQ